MRGKRIFDTSMGNGSISLVQIGSMPHRAVQLCDVAYMDHAGKAQLCHLNGKGFNLRRPYRRDAVADRSQRESADTVEQAAHGDLC